MKFTLRFLVLCFLPLALVAPVVAQHVIATIPLNHPTSVALNSKTNQIYVTGYGTEFEFSVIDCETDEVFTTEFFDSLGGIVVCTLCNKAFIGATSQYGSNYALVFDAKTGEWSSINLRFVFGPFDAALGLTRWIYAGDNRANDVYAMDGTNNLKIAARIPVMYPLVAAATDKQVYATSFDESLNLSIVVIDPHNNTVVNNFLVGGGINLSGMAVDGPGNLLYLATSPLHALDSTVSVYDATTGALLGTTEPVGMVRSLLALPGTGRAVVTGGKRDRDGVWHDLRFIDGKSFTVIRALRVGTLPEGVAYNPATKRFYVALNGDNEVAVIGN